ncbi:MAG TPA: NifB/NifX family molybdenum-iron cluster-binding protein [Desulfovibrio sp.]|jgi:predicted Fe-Mo cluster-binding NifX family protein|uniref:NifB/NifX family molybdenum-iron cluster-binding protein n=1 Tax=Desulfovibrio TaxID=872 RepID=UPI002A4B57DA|nr:NifB/NifX family molybdenum-iron cluster-binding protein [Desulfovibrio sp.]MDY0304800.1 NifB/NifX family molybdenum-iron cluster-binding protein [Desulfovibrionaceae bacterium]HMM39492.1 NifB/NifX family molybdenum-iron cluster-binding protein [Desulfovibrio sp.]
MRFAVPMAQGQLCMHFGHCEQFAVIDVDDASKTLAKTQMLLPPPHEPGLLPRWLKERGVTHVIAGGMGARARQLFEEAGVSVTVGAQGGAAEQLVTAFLGGSLVTGANTCDH